MPNKPLNPKQISWLCELAELMACGIRGHVQKGKISLHEATMRMFWSVLCDIKSGKEDLNPPQDYSPPKDLMKECVKMCGYGKGCYRPIGIPESVIARGYISEEESYPPPV